MWVAISKMSAKIKISQSDLQAQLLFVSEIIIYNPKSLASLINGTCNNPPPIIQKYLLTLICINYLFLSIISVFVPKLLFFRITLPCFIPYIFSIRKYFSHSSTNCCKLYSLK